MHSLAPETDVRAMSVVVDDARLVVDLIIKRTPTLITIIWFKFDSASRKWQ